MPWAKSQVNPAQVEQYFAQAGNTVGARLPHTQELDGMPCLRFPGAPLPTDRSHQRPDVFFRCYSAASICGPIASTFAAQNLNSGIFPNGSSAGLVRIFAAAST